MKEKKSLLNEYKFDVYHTKTSKVTKTYPQDKHKKKIVLMKRTMQKMSHTILWKPKNIHTNKI